MMTTWADIKRLLYIVLTIFGAGLAIFSFGLIHSSWFTEQIAGAIMFMTGCGLLIFGLVCYIDRDDWEIWS